ncbi:very short patch repair endonuclease [Kitasatospora sp. NPDC005751]|uniref:very short patch repair endonuclease n=1 Tax=Kitasatospora sp. NPDC005751 TaxID=3157064 RepID=UPI0033E3CAC7
MNHATAAQREGWKDKPPPERAWRGRQGRTRKAIIAEQDRAAGGREERYVKRKDGGYALGSITLKVLPSTRRIRAYLRWSECGRSPALYVGEVEHPTRAANLEQAWKIAKDRDMAGKRPVPEGSWASSSATRSVMRGNRGRDTVPELRIRSLVHREGLRYRVSARPLPGMRRTADLVFSRARVAVFIDGCFWHGCPEHCRPAYTNSDFWQAKIDGNRARDAQTDQFLADAGWRTIRIWEHEDPVRAAGRVAAAVRGVALQDDDDIP